MVAFHIEIKILVILNPNVVCGDIDHEGAESLEVISVEIAGPTRLMPVVMRVATIMMKRMISKM